MSSWLEQIGWTTVDKGDGLLRVLVYGEAGSGKTMLASTFPDPFFIDTDHGLASIERKVPFISLKRGDKVFDTCRSILRKAENKEPPFDKVPIKTIVFDSVTSLADALLYECLWYPGPGKSRRDPTLTKPDWDDYNSIQNKLKTLMKGAQDIGLNVVATCGVKLERDEIRGTFVGKPNIVGGYRDVVAHDFDEVYFLNVSNSGKKWRYVAYTRKYSYFEAKSRTKLPAEIDDLTYETLKELSSGTKT